MTIAAKHLDPLVGLDIHIILIPSPAGPIPTPLPHPYIGMVLDPMDYVPFLGAATYINGLPRGQAGTAGVALPPHIPMGGPFAKPPTNESEIFMGSAVVCTEDEPQSFLGCMVLSCHDIGMPPPPRVKRKSMPKTMMLPTTVVLSIPMGMIVMIGGPPTIALMGMAFAAALKGLKLLKKLGPIARAIKKASDKIHKLAEKLMKKLGLGDGLRNLVHKGICAVTGHPVDIATGKVFTDRVDFEMPGPIPFQWERTWFSTSTYQGPLGHGWHHSYDQKLYIDDEVILYQTGDGRHVGLPHLAAGTEYFDRKEKLTFFRDSAGYAIRNRAGHVHRFVPVRGRPANDIPLVEIQDALGDKVVLRYDDWGRLVQIVDSAGREINLANDQSGRVVALAAPHPDQPGQQVYVARYAYDDAGNLITVWDALGQPMTFQYQAHLLVKETDRNGLSFYFTYDGSDATARCIRTWGDGGIYDHKLTYSLDPKVTVVEDSLGYKNTYHHDGALVLKTVDALGVTTETEYNEYNEVVSEKDGLGRTSSIAYDARGNVSEVVGPDGAAFRVSNDSHDQPETTTDPIGAVWISRRDASGRVIETQDPLGHVTKYHYQGKWFVGMTDPAGGYTALGYDQLGNLRSITTPDGETTTFEHDHRGRIRALIDPRGAVQRRQFDELDRLGRLDEPDGNAQVFSYDPEGNVVGFRDQHRDVTFTFQGMGLMASRSEGGTTVRFEYDTEEQLIGLVNEHGFVYRFKVGPTGLVDEETGFGGLHRKYAYDAAGRVVRIVRAVQASDEAAPSTRFSEYEYDLADNVTKVTHSDGSVETYAYRLDGELISAAAGGTTLRFTRDALGQVLREVQGRHWVESEFDALGMRARVRSSLGLDQTVERNAVGEVTALAENTTGYETRYLRDQIGLEVERSLPGGVRSRWERDKAGRPTQHTISNRTKELRSVSYKWDSDDRLKTVINALKGATQYGHDSAGVLAWAKYTDGTVDLRMPDAVGNLFRSQQRNDRRYGAAGELLAARLPQGWVHYTYDLDGNLVEKAEPNGRVWRYDWNSAGMLARVHRPDGSVVEFKYDALGRRVSKTYRGQTTQWVWDGNNPVHEWVEGKLHPLPLPDQAPVWSADAEIKKREAELEEHLSQGPPLRGTKAVPVTWLFEPESFTPIARLRGDEQRSIITDHLGTPVQMTDEQGHAVWGCDVSAYGELRELEGARQDCPFRWPGQYEDAETGLHYNRFRYYDPDAGQYISQDPIGLEGSSQLYAYVADPLYWHDPMGLGKCGLQKRSKAANAKLRKAFEKSGGARSKFLKEQAAKRGAKKKYGAAAVAKMKKGQVPEGMVVHHKKPLFRGGDNRSSNLMLMSAADHTRDSKMLHYYPEGQNPFNLN